jgi:putative cardiolipin synthase
VELKVFHKVKIYNPLTWRLGWSTMRMHDKGVSADGIRMIRGGRNVESSYFGYSDGRNYIDRDIYVDSPELVKESDDYFDELFVSNQVEEPAVSTNPNDIAAGKQRLETAFKNARQLKELRLNLPVKDWSEDAVAVKDVRFFHDQVGDKESKLGIAHQLRSLLLRAQKMVLIESPYLIPTPEFLEDVATLKKAHPDIRIIIHTNSAVSTDGTAPQGGYWRHRQQLVNLGIELYEFKGPSALHAKSMVIDGVIAGVGSYNLDPRSQHLNSEIGVIVLDPTVAAQLTASITSHMDNAWKIGKDGKPENGDDPLATLTNKQRLILEMAKIASYGILIHSQL